jgi:ribose 1,5-bisphosphate isomerase
MTINSEIYSYLERIKNDRNQGASELARYSLEVLKTAINKDAAVNADQFLKDLSEVCESLYLARPVMAPIKNAVKLFQRKLSESKYPNLISLKEAALSIADNIVYTSLAAVNRIAVYARDILENNDVIMTQSYSSTVEGAIKMGGQKYILSAIVTRSGTSKIGQITAQEIQSYVAKITYIDDTAIGLYMNQAKKVFVGADRVCSDGSLVNGVGTCLMALAAKHYNVPFYVLCESLKIDPALKSNEAELEEKNPNELVMQGVFSPKIIVKNPYFDITPPELITGLITEDGVTPQQNIINYIKKLSI